ncbi:MAG: choice-of-anchor D domain-containing protein [Acidobacteriota bacterium]|nr:choice-of-anchor D domain-containing protein [Acidobacteriota bacterium]
MVYPCQGAMGMFMSRPHSTCLLEFRNDSVSVLSAILFVAALATFAFSAPVVHAQANVQGTWQTLPTLMPINPVHTALMRNGKILVVSGSGNYPQQTTFNAGVWDPSDNSVTTQTIGWDMFCNGMVVLPDGRPMIVGGNLQYDPFFGWNRTAIYNPATGAFTDMEDMAHGRWYPTDTILGDGRLLTFSGLNENSATNTQVEIYTAGAGWAPPISSPWTPPLYPRMHLLPGGKVFYSGPTTQSRTFNPANNTWSGVIATTNYGGSRAYGSSVLLPLTPANSYVPKVMIFGGGNPSTNTTEIIDLSVATPAWVNGPTMSQPRIEMNATLLPNGNVLAVGGSLNDEDTASASLQADLYDSTTNTMGSAGSNAFPRLYHSVSLLLPDATVWVAGGNPNRGSYENHVEIYTPPYLYQPNGTPATRPSITSVTPGVVGYGTAFTVQTPDAANIASVVLMKSGSVTHAFDMDQRMVGLAFTADIGVLNVSGPPDGNTAPPGYYMLFLLNNAGVPSVAQFVQISTAPADIPPAGSITSPATDVSIITGQAVTFAGTATANTGTIAGYSWSIRGGVPATSAVQNPGAVTFSVPGVYQAAFTVTDSAGITDPNPPVRTITVVPAGPAPTLASATPNSGAQGQTNLSVTLAGTNFAAAPTCSFGAGVEVNSCTFNTSTQITANIDVLAGALTGPRDVVVTNTDTQSATLTGGFTVTAGAALPAPTLTGVSPNSEFQGASNVTVTLTGTNFQPSPTCNFDTDFGGTINTCTFVSPTQINVNLSIAANTILGGHNVSVTNADGQTATIVNGFTVTEDLGNTVNLGSGFTVGALVLNGNAQLNGSVLELTDGGFDENSSAWYATPVNVQSFVNDFTFQITPGTTADGMTFALQANSTAAIGLGGGGLGYGPVDVGDPGGIPNSVAIKFDLYDNNGEGVNSTGLYVNGASPSIPADDLTPAGIDLHSGDSFAVHMTYDGTTLALTITDTVTNAVFTKNYLIDIPNTLGANVTTAYAGFTGGTGGLTATQNILTWTLVPLAPVVAFSPAGPVAFPDTTVNVTSAPITITITNGGTGALHITGVTLGGTNPGDFAAPAASDTCTGATVAANATCTLNVTFTPSGTGARQADLQIADDAPGSPQTLSLTGNGLAAATPGVTITPASPVTFPSTAQGVSSAPITVTVTNTGNATLNITTVTITGTNAADFATATNTCNGAALAANAACTVGVVFTPSAVGVRTATFQVADNAPASPQSATLTGTGTAASSTVSIAPNPLTLSATQGTVSAPGTVTITNTGNAPLQITGVAFGGANVSEFVNPASSCTTAIAPNANCTISVSFAPLTPASATARTETITLTDNAANSPQTVTVTGTVNASAFTVTSPAASLAATVTAGQTAQYSVQLTPGPGYSGTVTMACSGAPATTTCTVANPIQLTAGTPTTFTVMVTTTARSLLLPFSGYQPAPPSTPYLLLLSLGLCMAIFAALYPLRLRAVSVQRQFVYGGGLLVLVLAVCGLAGCASSGNSPGPGSTGTQAGTYTLTLTPTAASTSGQPLQLTPIQLTLTVN